METYMGQNVNGDEFQLMVAYKDVKSSPANWKKIKDFASGKFDVEEMVIFLVAMAPIFKDKPPFTPDLAVRQYNHANYRDTLTLDPNTINYDPNPQGSHRKCIRDTTPSANQRQARAQQPKRALWRPGPRHRPQPTAR